MVNNYSADLERGSSQSFSVADASQTGLDLTADFTISLWIKPESLPNSSTLGLIAKNSSTLYSYMLRIDTDGSGVPSLLFAIGNSGAIETRSYASAPLTVGVWSFVCVRYTSSTRTAKFWVDSSTSSGTLSGSISTAANTAAPFWIGNDDAGSGRYFDGLVNNVLVYNDDIADAVVEANRDTPCSPSTTNLVSWWFSDNNNGNDLFASNNLTNNNSATFVSDVPFSCSVGPANVKTWDGLALANVKTINGLAIASVKSVNGLA